MEVFRVAGTIQIGSVSSVVLTMVETGRETTIVQYLPRYVSAKKAPISGVRKHAPTQAETFCAAVTLLSWSTVVT